MMSFQIDEIGPLVLISLARLDSHIDQTPPLPDLDIKKLWGAKIKDLCGPMTWTRMWDGGSVICDTGYGMWDMGYVQFGGRSEMTSGHCQVSNSEMSNFLQVQGNRAPGTNPWSLIRLSFRATSRRSRGIAYPFIHGQARGLLRRRIKGLRVPPIGREQGIPPILWQLRRLVESCQMQGFRNLDE
jgi:hypothetical protein